MTALQCWVSGMHTSPCSFLLLEAEAVEQGPPCLELMKGRLEKLTHAQLHTAHHIFKAHLESTLEGWLRPTHGLGEQWMEQSGEDAALSRLFRKPTSSIPPALTSAQNLFKFICH